MGVYSNNPDYWKGRSSSRSVGSRSASGGGSSESSESVELYGFIENQEKFEHMLTYEPNFDRHVRKLIKELLKEARKNIVKDLGEYLKNDPRKAYRAVKHVVYKQLFGGNVSILKKRKAGAKYELIRQRTLQPGQRGGNRWPRIKSRNRLDQYYGSDRGFILRFLSSGTVDRETHYGSRGHIERSDLFGHIAPWHMQQAAMDLVANINEYIKRVANG
jgi:hypothetical protein